MSDILIHEDLYCKLDLRINIFAKRYQDIFNLYFEGTEPFDLEFQFLNYFPRTS